MSLLTSMSQFSSEISSSQRTVSMSKYLFKLRLNVRLLGSGSVEILLNGLFAFLPKCASNGDIFIVFWRHILSWYIIEFIYAFKLN